MGVSSNAATASPSVHEWGYQTCCAKALTYHKTLSLGHLLQQLLQSAYNACYRNTKNINSACLQVCAPENEIPVSHALARTSIPVNDGVVTIILTSRVPFQVDFTEFMVLHHWTMSELHKLILKGWPTNWMIRARLLAIFQQPWWVDGTVGLRCSIWRWTNVRTLYMQDMEEKIHSHHIGINSIMSQKSTTLGYPQTPLGYVKVWFYIALYPVRWTAQSALHFPPLTDLFIPVHSYTVPGFSWKHSIHAAIAQRLFTHISTTVYSQVLIYTAESTEASWSERKCPNFETVTTGIRTRALSIASPAFYQLSYRAPL